MSDTKGEFAQSENGATSPTHHKRTKKQKLKAHFKRFWWVHLIIFLCLVVLGVCLTIFVGVPNIAQDKLDASELEIQGVNVLETTPDSFLMQINSTIKTDGTIKAKIYGFEGHMYLEDADHTPFASLQFPQTNGDKHQKVNISQTVQIKNREAFDRFNIWFANNETLRVTIEGDTHVTPSGLFKKFGVHFKKTLDVKGLNLFKGTKVVEGEISISGHPNFNGVAEIPNPSYFTLDIGNATFINFLDDVNLGNLNISNLLLRPGTNRVNITADLDQQKTIKIASSSKYCEDGVAPVLPMKLLGTKVVNDGQKLEYFQKALASANQTVPIDFGKYYEDSIGVPLQCDNSTSTGTSTDSSPSSTSTSTEEDN